jgi:hypothetical protein
VVRKQIEVLLVPGGRPSLAYDSRPQFVGVLLDVDLREIPRYFRKRMISSPIACVSFLR